MLNKPFEIETIDSSYDTLLLEIGETYCVVSFLNTSYRAIKGLQVYTFDAFSIDESIREILNNIPTQQPEQVIVSPAFPEALLVPRKIYSAEADFIKVIYNVPGATHLHDVIAEWQVVNAYAVPPGVHDEITTRFPLATFTHVYTPFLKTNNEFTSDYQLMVHFIHNQFRVLLKIHQQIHLLQTYTFASPMDVVYYLLKIVTEFHLSQEEVHLILSGFVDENSPLYKELHSYFLNIRFVSATTVSLPRKDHPDHFFTSVHNLAACAL